MRRYIAVLAAPVKCFYQIQDHFSDQRPFFEFPDQYQRLIFHVSKVNECRFSITWLRAPIEVYIRRCPTVVPGQLVRRRLRILSLARPENLYSLHRPDT